MAQEPTISESACLQLGRCLGVDDELPVRVAIVGDGEVDLGLVDTCAHSRESNEKGAMEGVAVHNMPSTSDNKGGPVKGDGSLLFFHVSTQVDMGASHVDSCLFEGGKGDMILVGHRAPFSTRTVELDIFRMLFRPVICFPRKRGEQANAEQKREVGKEGSIEAALRSIVNESWREWNHLPFCRLFTVCDPSKLRCHCPLRQESRVVARLLRRHQVRQEGRWIRGLHSYTITQ